MATATTASTATAAVILEFDECNKRVEKDKLRQQLQWSRQADIEILYERTRVKRLLKMSFHIIYVFLLCYYVAKLKFFRNSAINFHKLGKGSFF
jgi:hypothetical protein